MNADFRSKDREQVVEWSNELLTKPFVLADSETTGLGPDAEIVQLAILKSDGTELINTLLQCRNPQKVLEKNDRGTSAFDIHGIHPDHLIGAPQWDDIHSDVLMALNGQRLIIYNKNYDLPLIEAACNSRTLLLPTPRLVECAMIKYAAYMGEIGYRGDYKWQRLPAAPGVKAHDALGDCLSTLYLIKRMAGAL